jgi:predicted dinucleotide-binding enzyme
VIVANQRGREAMADLLTDLGERGRAGSVEQAARARDLVVVATPLTAWEDLPPEAFDGRVVVDTANYFPQYVGRIDALEDGTTSSQMLAARLPGARLVKAFNTRAVRRGHPRPPRSHGMTAVLPHLVSVHRT